MKELNIRIQNLMHSDYNKFKKGTVISLGKESVIIKFDDGQIVEYNRKFFGKELDIIDVDE